MSSREVVTVSETGHWVVLHAATSARQGREPVRVQNSEAITQFSELERDALLGTVHAARLHEIHPGDESHVAISASASACRDARFSPLWQLPAVLLDRWSRGQWHPAAPLLLAIGGLTGLPSSPESSPNLALSKAAFSALRDWLATERPKGTSVQLISAVPLSREQRIELAGMDCRIDEISTLDDLQPRVSPNSKQWLHTGCAWFPWVNAADAELVKITVTARQCHDAEVALPRQPQIASQGQTIVVPGIPVSFASAAATVIASARSMPDEYAAPSHTVAHFARRVDGASFELALVMADRFSRGLEPTPSGRLIATGRSRAWMTGRVEAVDGAAQKLQLLTTVVAPGDRILLPADWSNDAQHANRVYALTERARAVDASLAFIERIG